MTGMRGIPQKKDSWKMFNHISPSYDKINRILSFGLDLSWRKQLIYYLPRKKNIFLLDVATGTGDQTIPFLKIPTIQKITGIDLAEKMLEIARKKINDPKVNFLHADASKIPFENESYHCITFSFGIRNVGNLEKTISELYRVLKTKGKLLILEFSLPKNKVIRAFHLFYLRNILPIIGGFFSKEKKAYQYLNQTIETFPYGKEFCKLLKSRGFSKVSFVPFTLGTVSLYIAEK